MMNKNKITGVYCIFCKKTERRYIGSSVDITHRLKEHKSRLRNNKHFNHFLQNDWNKCGEKWFEYVILEKTSKKNQLLVEQKWINKYYDNQNFCYNMRPFVDSCKGRPRSKKTREKLSKAHRGKQMPWLEKTFDVKIIDPHGNIFGPITNLEAFCREHKLNSSALWLMINGLIHTTYGWRLLGTPDDETLLKMRGQKISKAKQGIKRPDVFNRCAKYYNIKLIDPKGNIHGPIYGLARFARKHNLTCSKLGAVINKKAKSHKGWRLLDEQIS